MNHGVSAWRNLISPFSPDFALWCCGAYGVFRLRVNAPDGVTCTLEWRGAWCKVTVASFELLCVAVPNADVE